ncbi:MAG: tetraacyldisaccharide 4'-kinase [Paracoccaceae bacterium]
MKAPGFWSNPPDRPGWQASALAPLAMIWKHVTARRIARGGAVEVGAPVLCIGNLTAGGTGKTPMVAALMARLSQQGIVAHVVSRGYGGTIAGPHLVDPLEDTAADVGDEPLMLAARGLVWVAKDRIAGAKAAVAGGAKLILLDDGFQNPGLHKDGAIVMIDAGAGFGNGHIIPAGPLREPIADGLARADLAVLIGADSEIAKVQQLWPALDALPNIEACLAPVQTGLPISGEDVIAFAGIGRPAKFFDTLRGMNANLIATHGFPDHHAYAPKIIRRLIAEARARDAMLVTTEKDAVRLPASLRPEVLTIQVDLEPADWAPIDALVSRLVGA